MRVLLLVCVVLMSGCCSSWRAGTPTLRGGKYDASLEPWVGDGARARRETQFCNYLIGGPMYHSRWMYEGSRQPMKENPTAGEKRLYEEGKSGHHLVQSTNYFLDWLTTKEFKESHDIAVVCIRPLVFATYPEQEPTGWIINPSKYSIGYNPDIRGATEFETTSNLALWKQLPGVRQYEREDIAMLDGGIYRVATDWGTLVFVRNGDTYTVTTEGLE